MIFSKCCLRRCRYVDLTLKQMKQIFERSHCSSFYLIVWVIVCSSGETRERPPLLNGRGWPRSCEWRSRQIRKKQHRGNIRRRHRILAVELSHCNRYLTNMTPKLCQHAIELMLSTIVAVSLAFYRGAVFLSQNLDFAWINIMILELKLSHQSH